MENYFCKHFPFSVVFNENEEKGNSLEKIFLSWCLLGCFNGSLMNLKGKKIRFYNETE